MHTDVVTLVEGQAISWKQLKIRPTALGLGMLLVAAATWLVALNFSINIAYALAFWIFSFVLWAMIQSVMQIYGIIPKVSCIRECFAGENAGIYLSLDSRKPRKRLILLRFDDLYGNNQTDRDWQYYNTENNNTQFVVEFETYRRGLFTVPVLQLYSHAPFALLSIWVSVQLPNQVMVYPAPKEHQYQLNASIAGESANVIVAGGEDPSYLAEYTGQESLRHIAWKQYAKSQRLLVKKFEDTVGSSPDIISYKDYQASGVNNDELASLLCYRVLKREEIQQRYILELPQETIPPQNHQREKALHALSVM